MIVSSKRSKAEDIAGLMLSGIISDTLKFTSPTTTDYDKFVSERLAYIANIDIDDYSKKMFNKFNPLY